MQLKLNNVCRLLILSIVFLPACQKNNFPRPPAGEQCRLYTWHGLDDGYLRTLHYNSGGLMDSWHETAPLYDEDIFITINYGFQNRVSKIDYADHGTITYTILPVYQSGRVKKELWFNADNSVYDTIANTYDANGRLARRESALFGYYTAFEYDKLGNNTVALIKDAITGALYDSTIQIFDQPVIEPMVAAPGMPYPIPFTNYVICPLKYSDLIEFDPDENGNIVKTYDQDNTKSVLTANQFHFASTYDTYDLVSGLENRQVWNYQNCDCDNKTEATPNSMLRAIKQGIQNSFFHNTVPEVNKKITALRKLKK